MASFEVSVYESRQLQLQLTFRDTVVVGRQEQHGPPPFESYEDGDETRLVIAEHAEKAIPRRWFRLSSNEAGQLTIENLHRQLAVVIGTGVTIAAGQTQTFEAQLSVAVGQHRSILVKPLARRRSISQGAYRSLASMPPTPGSRDFVNSAMTLRDFSEHNGEAVVDLLRLALGVVQEAANTDAFFQAAVDAACEILALDRALVLLRESNQGPRIESDSWVPDDWYAVAERLGVGINRNELPRVSQNIIQHVVSDTLTQIHDPTQAQEAYAHSLQNVSCVVASPILDHQRSVIGVLYGDRWSGRSGIEQIHISDVEATLVEVLAGTVAGGIARTVEERHRNSLAEHFSPSVADKLATNPDLMLGQDAEVSVLFCDIRGFGSVTEQLGPRKTIEWINDVLSDLSQCVVDTDGVLVDYVGDELLAMWGAPVEQPDHAQRAVETALAMLTAIELLRERWQAILPHRFGAGIGVNTGPARVGNVGSRLKFKYGVLGNTVNVGSRLQSATKQLGVDCLISGATAIAAGRAESARRLAKLSVVGIQEPMDVYQIVHSEPEGWDYFREEYQAALADFESQEFGEATRRLGQLMQSHPGDRPCKLLLSKAVEHLDEPLDEFSSVWVLTQK